MKNIRRMAVAPAILAVLAAFIPVAAQSRIGDGRGGAFDVTNHSIRLEEIQSGGPPKDGIPSLTDPGFVSVKEGDRFLVSRDRELGVVHEGVAKAYPIKILNWHEVVNDQIAGKAIAVSW
jgi:hypothetical protein